MTKKKTAINEVLENIKETILSCDVSGYISGKPHSFGYNKGHVVRFQGRRIDSVRHIPVNVSISCTYLPNNRGNESFNLNIRKSYYEKDSDEMKQDIFNYNFSDKDEYHQILDTIHSTNQTLFFECPRYQELSYMMHQIIQLSNNKIITILERKDDAETLILSTKVSNRFRDNNPVYIKTVLNFDHYEHLDYTIKYIFEYVMNAASISGGDILYILHKWLSNPEEYRHQPNTMDVDRSRSWYSDVENSEFGIKDN